MSILETTDRVDLYDIFRLFFVTKSILSKLKMCLILNFWWFLLINDWESKNEFDC